MKWGMDVKRGEGAFEIWWWRGLSWSEAAGKWTGSSEEGSAVNRDGEREAVVFFLINEYKILIGRWFYNFQYMSLSLLRRKKKKAFRMWVVWNVGLMGGGVEGALCDFGGSEDKEHDK